jgi:hypothetical protein
MKMPAFVTTVSIDPNLSITASISLGLRAFIDIAVHQNELAGLGKGTGLRDVT